MTNANTLKFRAKYSLDYLNGSYILTRLRGNSYHILEEDIDEVLSAGIVNMTEEEFQSYMDDLLGKDLMAP